MPDEREKSRAELYITLFLLSFVWFVAANVGLRSEREVGPLPSTAAALSEQNALAKLLSSKWFLAGALATLIISSLLLTFASIAKRGGRSPVPQAPRNEVTWNIWAIVKSIVIFIFLYITALWTIYFLGKRLPMLREHLVIRLLTDGGLKALVCFWIYIMLRREYGAHLSNMGIRLPGIGKALLYAFLGYISILCVVCVAGLAWSFLGEYLGMEKKENPVVTLLLTERSRSAVLATLFIVVVLTPLTEEFYFRVLTFCALRKSFGFWASAAISSLYFALIHLNFYSVVPIFILGIFLAYIYERTQNFASAVFVHALHNGIQVSLFLSVRQA